MYKKIYQFDLQKLLNFKQKYNIDKSKNMQYKSTLEALVLVI